jgi:hypothetical protein
LKPKHQVEHPNQRIRRRFQLFEQSLGHKSPVLG